MHRAQSIHPIVFEGLQFVLNIGAEDIDGSQSFITLGGDSLAAVRLATYCTERHLSVTVRDILRSSRIHDLGENTTSHCSKDPKSSILASAFRSEPIQNEASVGLLQDEEALTETQLAFIHENEVSPGSNIIRFSETYPASALPSVRQAWNHVIDQEAVFHTPGTSCRDGNSHHQWTEVKVDSEQDYRTQLIKANQTRTRLSCFKAVTLEKSQSADSISTVVWCVHHAFIDGYSARLLHQKMIDVANGHITSPGPSFWAVASELKELKLARRTATREYWTSQYAMFHSAAWEIDFPSPRLPSEIDAHGESTLTFDFPHDRIAGFSAAIGVTPAAFYCSAWGLALSKLMNNDQVAFGIVFSGRDLPVANIHETIGPCINTLPLFISSAKSDALDSPAYIQSVFRTLSEYSDFQLAQPGDGITRQYSSVLAFQYDMSSKDCDPSYDIRPIGQSSFTMESDIPISVIILDNGAIQVRFNQARYNTGEMEILGKLFQNAMEVLLECKSSLLVCLDQLISTTEKAQILHTSNCNTMSTFGKNASKEDDIVTLFEKTCDRFPESIAAVRGKQAVSYHTLNCAASSVARALGHIRPGEAVCVIADRSINWLVAAFGILKARGVYVPLDPKVPSNVRNENFERCRARTFVATTHQTISSSPQGASERLVVEDITGAPQQQEHEQRNSNRAHPFPEDAAYICFTSGSTGKPKAVQCTHRGLAAFLASEEIRLHAKHGTHIAQTMSPVFDGSILEIFSALCYGATIHLPEENAEHPFEHVKECDVALFTPSVGKVLDPQDYNNLKHVYMVGEPVPQSVCDKWANNKSLYNMYGPTESTCGATLKRLSYGEKVSIGYPNPSSRVYVLDRNKQLMPAGTIGEIYTAGVQVSQGYLGQPKETARKFSADSVLLEPTEMMYQTGDLGHWDVVTQELHCKGRMDRQIKLRGFRLDLQDLEVRIARAIPESTNVAVYRKEDILIAVLQPASLDVTSVRARILKEVPGYATPRRIIIVDDFPLTAAGKLDYKALETMKPDDVADPATHTLKGTEQSIAQSWREVLQLGPETDISSDTDFLALGGHSLLQIKLANMLSRKFNRHISMKTIIENSRIQSLSVAIDAIADTREAFNAVNGSPLGPHGVSPIERDWLAKYEARLGTSAFNVSHVYELNAAAVDYSRLCDSWDKVLARHKILRSRFISHAGGVRIYQDHAPRTEFVKGLDARKLINHEFELELECPVRITVSPRYLVICISHIICDLTTLRSLLDEFSAFYYGFSPPAPKQQYDNTYWARKTDDTIRDFWRGYLPRTHEPSTLMTGRTRHTFHGTSYVRVLVPSSQRILASLLETYNLTHHQVSLAIVSLALGSVFTSDIVYGGPFMCRSEDDENTIGLFLQPLPICIPQTPKDTPVHQFLASLRASSQSALANAIPWDAILGCLAHSSSPQATSNTTYPLPEVMVTFHDEREHRRNRLGLEGFDELNTWSEGAKFPLMFEFTLTEELLMLRVEYSDEMFTREEIMRHVCLVESILGELGVDSSVSVGKVVEEARTRDLGHPTKEVEFGSKR
ncbi:unnamed protein product [Periconia digitata]|uniref:Carrier domain-containing protein n=1 Tax=Periconia digitata TaxID=1303443 RepID=A0A9W4XF19_9PLEO|nr:unnamed protein product [Periconia digitata]